MTIKRIVCITIVLLALLPTLAISDYLNCPCKVVKVTDGDTVHVLDQANSRHKIRLKLGDFYRQLEINKSDHFGYYLRDVGYIYGKSTVTYRYKR